jgi:hypothetical protein
MIKKGILFIVGLAINTIRSLYRIDAFLNFRKLKNTKYNFRGVNLDSHKKNIFIFPYRVQQNSNLFEGIVGEYLSENYNVHVVLCKRVVKLCDHHSPDTNKYLKCATCYYSQHNFMQTFTGINLISVSDYIEKDSYYEELVDKYFYSLQAGADILYKNVPINIFINMSLQRYWMTAEPDYLRDLTVTKGFLKIAISNIDMTQALIDNFDIHKALISHGIYSTWGPIVDVLNKNKIDVTVWGRTYKNAEIQFARGSSYIFETAQEPVDVWTEIPLSREMKTAVKDYIESKNPKNVGKNSDSEYYYNYETKYYSIDQIESSYDINNRTVFVLYANIPWDGQALQPSRSYPIMAEWYRDTIEFMANNGEKAFLFIRVHPAEEMRNVKGNERLVDYLNNNDIILPNNVQIISSNSMLSSYNLAEIAQINLFYSSTLAFELLYHKKIIINAGLGFYSNKGIVYEPANRKEYTTLLLRGMNGKIDLPTPETHDQYLKYAYHYLFRRNMPEEIIDFGDDMSFENFKISSIKQLDKARGFNSFIQKFLNGDDYYFEA